QSPRPYGFARRKLAKRLFRSRQVHTPARSLGGGCAGLLPARASLLQTGEEKSMNILSNVLGLLLGVVIGGLFAWMQMQALRRNELLEKQEKLPRLLRQIPGSGGRCAFLLIALVLAQVLFPSANLLWLSGGFLIT